VKKKPSQYSANCQKDDIKNLVNAFSKILHELCISVPCCCLTTRVDNLKMYHNLVKNISCKVLNKKEYGLMQSYLVIKVACIQAHFSFKGDRTTHTCILEMNSKLGALRRITVKVKRTQSKDIQSKFDTTSYRNI
jgi:hypothetical protein